MHLYPQPWHTGRIILQRQGMTDKINPRDEAYSASNFDKQCLLKSCHHFSGVIRVLHPGTATYPHRHGICIQDSTTAKVCVTGQYSGIISAATFCLFQPHVNLPLDTGLLMPLLHATISAPSFQSPACNQTSALSAQLSQLSSLSSALSSCAHSWSATCHLFCVMSADAQQALVYAELLHEGVSY